MKITTISFLFLALGLSSVSMESKEDCNSQYLEYQDIEGCDGYDPFQCYYPYCSIYQDSRVRYLPENNVRNYWPAQRNDSFIDSFTR